MTIRMAEPQELEAVWALRYEVFVEEQGVSPAEERDAHDATARHYVAEVDGILVGCARVLEDGTSAHIGRLAVRRSWRGRGVGTEICRYIIADCARRGCGSIWLNAQLHAVGFYEKLGFSAVGEVFPDAGIEHRRMEMLV